MKNIQLYITNKCSLNCEFCIKSKRDISNIYMDLDTFKKVVDKCVDNGVKTFELTPIVGDILADENLIKRLEYLEQNDGVKRYWFFTNLINLTEEHIYFFAGTKKMSVTVSVYGDNKDIYLQNTNKDLYDVFVDNLLRLMTSSWFVIDEFNIRFKGFIGNNIVNNLLHRLIAMRELYGKFVDVVDDSDNFDWENILNSDTYVKKSGVCRYARKANVVFPNGDVSLCGCLDIEGTMYIGNILTDDFDYIMNKRNSILIRQREGNYYGICKSCTLFDINDD